MIVRQQSINSVDLTKINLDSLRPPKVWNYPIFRLKKLKLEKNADGKLSIAKIRNVDPSQSYVDGRVQRFNKLFETLYKKKKKKKQKKTKKKKRRKRKRNQKRKKKRKRKKKKRKKNQKRNQN